MRIAKLRLSRTQRQLLFDQGYVVLTNFVAKDLVDSARREINISMGKGMNVVDMPQLRVKSFCPELRDDSTLMALLLDSGIWDIAQSIIGEGQIRSGSQGSAQINLRFPVEVCRRTGIEPHLDGMASRSNGVPSGELHSFTALIGIMLSDLPLVDSGNFTVWPGSHILNASYLRENGPKSLLEGMPSVNLPEPVQITGKAGDIVIAHYLLSHGTAPNWSCDIRYMVFFRLVRINHRNEKWTSLTDPWLQWPGILSLDSVNQTVPGTTPEIKAVYRSKVHDWNANIAFNGTTLKKSPLLQKRKLLTCGLKLTHDGAIALLEDNRLIFSIEVEKLNNNPRFSGIGDSQRIADALESHGYSPDDIDQFVVDGWGVAGNSTASDSDAQTALVRLSDCEKRFDLKVMRYREQTLNDDITKIRSFNGLPIAGKVYPYSSSYHVTGHILSAYLTSSFSKIEANSYVLVWDGGIYPSLYYVRGRERKIDCLGSLFRFYGNAYAMFASKFQPFQDEDPRDLSIAGKVMAYISLGQVQPPILKLLKAAGKDRNNNEYDFPSRLADFIKAETSHLSYSSADYIFTFHTYLQGLLCATLEQVIVGSHQQRTNLCITGGCALNIKWNSAIRDLGLFNDIYIPPFPNDSGSAIGAASTALFARRGAASLDWSVYSGPRLHGATFAPGWEHKPCSLLKLATILYQTQEPIIFLNGRSELGPRALGNRSILASAASSRMKDILNTIKNREHYRPIAPICLEEWASKIFDPGLRDPYMLFEHQVRSSWRDRIPAVVHLDQTARLQTVNIEDNPALAELLRAYGALSGVPVLCNTSANLQGAGFFPDVRSATAWNRVNYVWSDNILYERSKKHDFFR